MKKISVVLIAVLLIFMTTGCGSNDNASSEAKYNRSKSSDNYGTTDESYDMAEPEMAMDFGGAEFTVDSNDVVLTYSEAVPAKTTERKIIKSSNMDIETLEYEIALQKLQDKIKVYGGYIESSSISGKSLEDKYRTRSAYYTIRIPVVAFEDFMNEMNTVGNIINENSYGEDITSSYFDTDARVKTLLVQEERLLEILKKAELIEDIIQLEAALSNVRYEIESLTGTLRRYDNLVSFATLSVSIREVHEITVIEEAPKTLLDKMSNAFSNTIENIKAFFEEGMISGVASIPYLVFIIPGLLIIILMYKRVKKAYKSEEPTKESIESEETPQDQ